MALEPSLAFTSLGEGPTTVEFWLDLLCPFSSRATAVLHSYIVPSILPGGKYHGKFRVLIRPYPQPWHPQGGYSCLSLFNFGRGFCQPGNPYGGDSRLWFEYFAALAAKIDEFKDPQALPLTGHEYNAKLAHIGAETLLANVEKLGLKNIPDLESAKTFFANEFVKPDQLSMKYFIRLGRQNSINTTLSVVWNGLYDREPQSSWKEAEWDEYLSKKGITPN